MAGIGNTAQSSRWEREPVCLRFGVRNWGKYRMDGTDSGSNCPISMQLVPGVIRILQSPPGSSWLKRWKFLFLFLECFTVCRTLIYLFFNQLPCQLCWTEELGLWIRMRTRLCDIKWFVQGHTVKGQDSRAGLLTTTLLFPLPQGQV